MKDVGAFYKQALARGWTEDYYTASEESISAEYTNTKDDTLTLSIEVEKTDAGTQVTATLISSK